MDAGTRVFLRLHPPKNRAGPPDRDGDHQNLPPNLLVADFGDLAVHQLQILVNLGLVLLVHLGGRESGDVGQDDQSQTVEPSSDVGEGPENEEIL